MAERITVNSRKPVSIKENLISHKRKTNFRSNSSPVNRILYLQRTIGNQAVQRMVRSGALQAKLRIGQPRDVYEQEADRVADAVMRMPKPQVQRQVEPEEEEEETLQSKPLANPITPLVQVQRQEEPEEEEEMLQAKSLAEEITPLVQRQVEPEEEDEELQAKGLPSQTSKVIPNLESHINVIRGGGQPLSESTRAFFEPRFGYDFSQVRIHSNSEAAEMAGTLNAKAFTTGRDVVFGAGQYSPETSIGMRLLAHELTHVHQQQSSLNGVIINRYPRGALEEWVIAKGKKKTDNDCTPASGIPNTNCGAYAANSWWLPSAYVNNATCACQTTPNVPTANCVRKLLQDRLAATPGWLKVMAFSRKSLDNPKTYAKYQAFVQTFLTPGIYRDHVYAYRSCCCPSGPAPYPAWIGVTSVPLPCSVVGWSIRYFGSCHGTPGRW